MQFTFLWEHPIHFNQAQLTLLASFILCLIILSHEKITTLT